MLDIHFCMDKNDIDWSLYRSFLAVMREGSLSGAARALHMTQPSIGRHIDALEAALAVVLFTRAASGLKPTPMAHELLAPVEAMAAAVQHASRVTTDLGEARGTVRITASQVIGGEVLPAILTRYRETHPHVAIELVLSNRNEDLLNREADIAVRMMRPTQQALIARHIGTVDIGLFAHQDYIKAHGMPGSLPELLQHAVIGFDQDPSVAALAKQFGLEISRDLFVFRTDSDLAQLAALRAGMGIAGCQLGVARREPELVPVLTDQLTMSLDMWLATHSGLRQSRLVMDLFAFLGDELRDYARSSARPNTKPDASRVGKD